MRTSPPTLLSNLLLLVWLFVSRMLNATCTTVANIVTAAAVRGSSSSESSFWSKFVRFERVVVAAAAAADDGAHSMHDFEPGGFVCKFVGVCVCVCVCV